MPKGDWNNRPIPTQQIKNNETADKADLQIGMSAISNNQMPIEGRLALVPQYDWAKVEPPPGQAEFWRRVKGE